MQYIYKNLIFQAKPKNHLSLSKIDANVISSKVERLLLKTKYCQLLDQLDGLSSA